MIKESYREMLITFRSNDYDFIFFPNLHSDKHQVILRHDIDFDCELAFNMALIEHELNIRSTFFFLVSSDSYNILTEKNRWYINEIKKMGHVISIHFDTFAHEDLELGLQQEADLFQKLFEVNLDVISFHRPNHFYQSFNVAINNIAHTYQDRYFRNIAYYSDSTGLWRFGNPLDSTTFQNQSSMQLLIHPIWWLMEGRQNHDKVENYYAHKIERVRAYYESILKPSTYVEPGEVCELNAIN